jgi:hypothetical protein
MNKLTLAVFAAALGTVAAIPTAHAFLSDYDERGYGVNGIKLTGIVLPPLTTPDQQNVSAANRSRRFCFVRMRRYSWAMRSGDHGKTNDTDTCPLPTHDRIKISWSSQSPGPALALVGRFVWWGSEEHLPLRAVVCSTPCGAFLAGGGRLRAQASRPA